MFAECAQPKTFSRTHVVRCERITTAPCKKGATLSKKKHNQSLSSTVRSRAQSFKPVCKVGGKSNLSARKVHRSPLLKKPRPDFTVHSVSTQDSQPTSDPSGNNKGGDSKSFYAVVLVALAATAVLAFGVQKAMWLDTAAFQAASTAFTMAFSIIFVSELGDKTFFIAALLAMRQNKMLVLTGTMGALGLMTLISVAIGVLFQKVPAVLSSNTLQYAGHYVSAAALVYFGVTILRDAYSLPDKDEEGAEPSGMEGELSDAKELVAQEASKDKQSPWKVLVETFTLIFVAEWGDRSMLATIALGAAQSSLGVAAGAFAGHLAASLIAITGGAILAKYITEKTVGYIGGTLFLVFAATTVMGIF